MSKIEEIEQAVERLPLEDFAQLAAWVEYRRQHLALLQPTANKPSIGIRDHSAFLNSYAKEDDGLYDDAAAG